MANSKKKQALAMFVAGMSVDAIARALEITADDARALLPKSRAQKPEAPPAPAPQPARPSAAASPEAERRIPIRGGTVTLYGEGGGLVYIPHRVRRGIGI